MNIAIISIIGGGLSFLLAMVLFVLFAPQRFRAKYNKFGKALHDFFNFRFLIIEKIFQFFYMFCTVFSLVGGFLMLFWVEEHTYYDYYYDYYYDRYIDDSYTRTEWLGYWGIVLMIFGPLVIRIVYEVLMLGLIAIKNIIQINNKLPDPNEKEKNNKANPFVAPAPMPFAPMPNPAPMQNFAPEKEDDTCFCPYCGEKKKINAPCEACGK